MSQFEFGPAKAQLQDFEGASSVDDGVSGLVPAPSAGDEEKVLKGDGTWGDVEALPAVTSADNGKALGVVNGVWAASNNFAHNTDFVGATSSTAGTHGLVPAPAAGDESLVLTAGGTWEESPGAKLVVATLTVTNTSGSYSNTVSDERITASMKPVCIEIGTPATFNSIISVTPGDGQYTISCSAVAGTSSVTISFQKVVEDPSAVTSSEFDLLNNRIGTLSNLTTTAKTNVVAAINEVVSNKISTSDIANNLTTTTEGKVLDARQGKSLSDAIGNIENMLTLPLPSSNVEIGKYNGYTMKLGCFQWVGAVPTTGNVDVTSYFPVNGQYIIMMIVVCKLSTTDIFVGNTQGRVNGTKLTLYNAPTSSSATYQIYYWYYAT